MELQIELDTRQNNWASINDSTFSRLFNSKNSPILRLSFDSDTFFISVKSDKNVFDQNVIRLSRELANCLSLSHGQSVFVTPFSGTLKKSSQPIVVSPSSVDDWEVVEASAQFLQDNMLSQLSIIVPGQRFPVWTSRGHKPIIFQVDNNTDSTEPQPILLSHDSEIAVQVMSRKDVSFPRTNRRGCLHARIVDIGFPLDLPNIGIICNQSDFTNFFSPDSGSLVTVRDRPEILTLIACDSNLVDPGIVLVSPTMRDKYALLSGERIVIEEHTIDIGNNIIIPKTVYLYVPSSCENKKFWTKKLARYISDSTCVIVPQGGWIDLGIGEDHEYCMLRFGLMTDTMKGALLTEENFDNLEVIVDQLPQERRTTFPRPFVKYVPEKIREFVKSRREMNMLDPLYPQTVPSFEPMIRDMHSYLESSISHADIHLPFVGSGILIGPSTGCGKTTALRQALERFSPPIDYAILNCSLLSNASLFRLEEVKNTIAGLVKYGFETPPYGIFFDNVDDLIPPETDDKDTDSIGEKASGQERPEYFIRRVKRGKIVCAFLEDLMYKLKPNRSIFLAATAVRDSRSLARLFVHCEKLPRQLSLEDRNFLLPKNSDGDFSKHSFMELVEIRTTGKDNREIRRKLLTEKSGESRVLATHTKLGGMDSQIETLVDAITLPLEFPYLFPPGITPSTGAFVIGPSGCGKSALIDAIITETKLPVEIVRGPDLLDKYIGASEQGVRRVFEKAVSIAPCIVVFDAIEALCPRRGSDGTGVTDRVVNQMLCYLDGVDKMEQVFVIAISSRPDLVDPALTRSGRLDITVICDVPDVQGRREIVQVLWDEFINDCDLTPNILDQLTSAVAGGCTGADIRAGFVNAKIEHDRNKDGSNLVDLVLKNVSAIKPSISPKERAMYDQILARYRGGGGPPPTVGSKTMLH